MGVDDHFLFMSGDPNLKVAGMEVTGQKAVESSTTKPKHSLSGSMKRISSESFPCKREVMSRVFFERLARGIKTVQGSVKAESGKDFQLSEKFGYIHSCPTNLGTGMRASVHVDLPDGPRKVSQLSKRDARN